MIRCVAVSVVAFLLLQLNVVCQPSLSVSESNKLITVSWPVSVPEFTLQAATNLSASANWFSITQNVSSNGGQNVLLTNSSPNHALFFRLFRACPTNDLPDASFLDENCDGIDGNVSEAVFVSPTGVDSPSAGTLQSPFKTINYAIQRAQALGKSQALLQSGTYPESVELSSGIGLYGGYDVNWTRAPHSQTGHTVTVQGAFNTNEQQFIAMRSVNSQTNQIADLVIAGPNATTNGLSSYAVYARQVNLNLERVTIIAGSGAAGLAGTNGLDALLTQVQNYMNGGNGGNAAEYSTNCDSTTRGTGGVVGTNGFSTQGGIGGAGGTMDTSCNFPPNSNPTPGLAGGDAAIKVGVQGAGGAGGNISGSLPQPGQSGTITNGGAGLTGAGYQLLNSFFYARFGTNGRTGQHGGGGGGGGGSGGNDDGIDSYGAGGGGGGAGGLAARGAGGGGGSGGSSFGVFALNSVIGVTNVSITLGVAGNGGAGGIGGRGQSGGAGGLGGNPAGTAAGGAGGRGGHGGHGGGGGGGQAGYSIGIAFYNSAVGTNNVTFSGGSAGAGGQSGSSAPSAPVGEQDGNPGQAGAAGVWTNVLSLSLSVP